VVHEASGSVDEAGEVRDEVPESIAAFAEQRPAPWPR
jgi:hypothetical protein